jgi:hypothetical protein
LDHDAHLDHDDEFPQNVGVSNVFADVFVNERVQAATDTWELKTSCDGTLKQD